MLHFIEIELCSEGEDLPDVNKTEKNKNSGVRYEYLAPNPAAQNEDTTPSETSQIPLADLMAKLKSM